MDTTATAEEDVVELDDDDDEAGKKRGDDSEKEVRGKIVSCVYRVIHLVVDLGWVDFDLAVPPSCPSTQPFLPNSYQPRQNWTDSPRPDESPCMSIMGLSTDNGRGALAECIQRSPCR